MSTLVQEPPPVCAPATLVAAYREALSNVRGLTDDEFDSLLRTAEDLLAAREEVAWVVEVAEAGVAAFNAGDLERAARLFAVAAPARQKIESDPKAKDTFEGTVASSELDMPSFLASVGDPDKHSLVLPILRYFRDLGAESLLEQLATETSPRRAELIINLVAIQYATSRLLVLNLLDWQEVQNHASQYLVHLLTALTRCGAMDPDERQRASNLAGRYLFHPNSRVREAAVAALEFIGGREVILPAVRALAASRYGRNLPTSDELKEHLTGVLALLARWGDERAIMMVAELATGDRDGGFRLGGALQVLAVNALLGHNEPLPPRAVRVIAQKLEELATNPLRLLTAEFLQSTEARVWAALCVLIETSDVPEAEAALLDSRLQHLMATLRHKVVVP